MIFPRLKWTFLHLKWTFLLGFLVRFFLAVDGRTTLESSFQGHERLQETSSEIPSKEANMNAESDFSCVGRPSGHYADIGSGCTVFYYCDPSGMKSQFKCPRLNLFHQKYNVCDWNFNVKCEESEKYFPNGKGAVNKNIPEFDSSFGSRRKSSQADSDNSRDQGDDEMNQKPKRKNSYEDEKEYDEPEEEIKPQKGKLEPKKDSFRGNQQYEDENSEEEDNKDNEEDNYKNNKNNGKSTFNYDFQQRATPKQDFGNQFSSPLFRGPFPNEKEGQSSRPTFPFQPVRKDFGQRGSFSTLVESRQSRLSDEDNENSEVKSEPSHFSENQRRIQNAKLLELKGNWDDEDRLKSGFITLDDKIRRPAAQRDFRQGFGDDGDGLSHGHHSDDNDDNEDDRQRNGPDNEAFRILPRGGVQHSDNENSRQFSHSFNRDDSPEHSFEERREFNDFSNGEGRFRGADFQDHDDNNHQEFDDRQEANRNFFDGGSQDHNFRGGRARDDGDDLFSNSRNVPFN